MTLRLHNVQGGPAAQLRQLRQLYGVRELYNEEGRTRDTEPSPPPDLVQPSKIFEEVISVTEIFAKGKW